MNPNQHIKDFLSYYLSFQVPPQFAVLLDGPWGIGKTFFVKSIVNSPSNGEPKHVYVSLYGLTSFDEIDDAIFRSMYPVLESKGAKIGGRALKTIGKYLNIEIDLKTKEFINRAGTDLYIFDDLERCELPINAVMGYINGFVEHDGRKVIIIANEAEIKDAEGYRRIREKLIGKTFHVQSVFNDAMDSFTDSIQNALVRSAVQANSSLISDIYHKCELNNLRVLQQTIWDFGRVHSCLEDRHRANDKAMAELMGLLFALSFEIKVGRLTCDDLKDRFSNLFVYSMKRESHEVPPPRIYVANSRYPTVNLASTILSDETLVNVIVRGFVDKDQIREDLDRSSFFMTVAREPSWRTVWNAHERKEEEVNGAIAEMERAFTNHEFVVTGEMLHVFGLRLWLANLGAISRSKREVVGECKDYIDFLYSNRGLELPSKHESLTRFSFDSYDGLAIHQADTSEYREVRDYLDEKRRDQDVERRPEIAEQLLANMANDVSLFTRRICLTNHDDNEFYDIPVLASLDPQRFTEKLLDLHPQEQRAAIFALQLRYERGRIDGELAAEREWAAKVRELLLDASNRMTPVSKVILQALVAFGLEEALGIQSKS
ncbi:P-loop NTPase fold protein [Ahniella affigens]|nr:P-loop NTPase fold protein [Ahniella affigens]